LNGAGGSFDRVDGPSGRKDSSERITADGSGKSDSLIESVIAFDSLSLLRIDESGDGDNSGSLNETGGFGIDVVDGAESSGPGADSG
jgi:hypothetical protein